MAVRGSRQHLGRRAAGDGHHGEHPRQQHVVGIGEFGARSDIARLGGDARVDRLERPVEFAPAQRVDAHGDLLAHRERRQRLLRERKIGIDRIEPLQG